MNGTSAYSHEEGYSVQQIGTTLRFGVDYKASFFAGSIDDIRMRSNVWLLCVLCGCGASATKHDAGAVDAAMNDTLTPPTDAATDAPIGDAAPDADVKDASSPDLAKAHGKDAGTPTGGPTLRQQAIEQTNGGAGVNENDSVKQFPMKTQKGNIIWVAATIPNDGGQANVTVSDTQGNTFKSLDFEQDKGKGTQSLWHFYALDIKGDTTTADTVTVHWANDNYKGVVIAEIAGATALVGHAGNIQDDNAAAGNDTVTSGDITVSAAQSPALLIAISMDTYGGTSDTGGDGDAGPEYGTNFTQVAYMWNWDPGMTCADKLMCNLGAFETMAISAAGKYPALFTARAPSNVASPGEYVTVAAIFH